MAIVHEVDLVPYSYVDNKYVPAVRGEVTVPESVGTTFRVYSRVDQIMSDVWEDVYYADYFDIATNQIKNIPYINYSETSVDITEENKALLKAYLVEKKVARWIYHEEADRAIIAKNDMIKVVKGRTNKGLFGKVVYSMDATYNMGYRAATARKFLIALDDETVEVEKYGKKYQNYVHTAWVWEHNCEKLNIEPVTQEEIDHTRDQYNTQTLDNLLKNNVRY